MEKITPRIDIAFKKIFGVEENKDLLISLINSIVSKEDQVVDVTLLNPYNPKNFRNDKLSILDIKAIGENNRRFNIEIQISDEADYDKRALYYWAKLYTEQLQAAKDYSTLNKAIGIHILNFISIPKSKKYHNVFHITEKESGLLYFKDLELHTIELTKFSNNPNEELPGILKKISNSLDMWSTFLTHHDLLNKDNLPQELNNNDLKKALVVLDIMNFTSEERDTYEDHLKWLRVEANTLKKACDKAKAEGIQIGKTEGIQIGKTEGIQIGEAKGKAEEKVAIAKNLLQAGVDVKLVAKSTGLTIKEIELIKCKQRGDDFVTLVE